MKKKMVMTFLDMKKTLPNDKDRKLIIDTEVLFRQFLGMAQSRDVDLKYVLSHELAAVPPALFHDDGKMRKTNKADLSQKLESNCSEILTSLPQIPDSTSSAYIIDGMAMIQSLNENHFQTTTSIYVRSGQIRSVTCYRYQVNLIHGRVVGDSTVSPTRFFGEEDVWIWIPSRI